MHKLIKAELEKDFDTLNKHLVNASEHSNLLLVIDTLKKVMDGAPYVDEVEDMFTKYPDLDSPPVQEAVSSIVDFLSGAHPLIDECLKGSSKHPLGYCMELTSEIVTNVNFFTLQANGDIIINDVSNMSFISEVEAMGRLSLTEQHEA
jgi:hypothetical protein